MARKYWEWKAPFEIKPEETALIIVDMQKGFADETGALFTPQAKEQIPVMVKLKKYCNDHNIPVFLSAFAQSEDFHHEFYWFRNEERGLLNEDGSEKLNTKSEDAEITEALAPRDDVDDVYFQKYTYSCFAKTDLEEQLKKRGIKTLIITGTVSSWCVDSTIRDAYHKDYNVVAVPDAISAYPHAGASEDQWNNMLFNLWAEGFGRVVPSDEIIKELEKNEK
ncbi:isochorismatase family cysteine hydrolase [uncultured Helcococcus sp.]|uniref:cysteine hydrolase family protein n=1 Tax=uncultured Helcococcus sp. TaxID=1072508 RepID=UPI00288988AC|nr:isochorismatase family cysteine hydrolase [uncultured Helcococcus sp.]